MDTLTVTPLEEVRRATIEAYIDCTQRWSDAIEKRRNLDFRAPSAVAPGEAADIMQEATPQGYNDFSADLLRKLPTDCEVTLAREGSVCVYVTGDQRALKLGADEVDFESGETRFWWD